MNDLIDTTEMYLKSIIELEEQGIVPLRARIAERLEHSGPTVSQTVARMERDGLVVVDADRHLALTDEGRDLATHVMRKHRLAERLLSDVVGLDWSLVHDEACRWEHVMSEQVETRLLSILPEHTTGPYGNPIPALEDLGADPAVVPDTVSLTRAVKSGETRTVGIAWLAEPLQVDIELLAQLQETGILPGAVVTVEWDGDYVSIRAEGSADVLDLPSETAAFVFVTR
ncbi:metal-dependent transcriptional regulator [Brevibacterium jeotgali]|uniref:Iron (Metal) dependent repressor, DtxR family n=1 Tax=Brevibacterium jeotgali TaxID=1262550 RepID=A0A2H1L436_9MICO|nr:metal-dependent transcriptional regulator [Brevibacterium jeotgali]TWB98749.1 DtxR family iron (metal) dependent repressor [Brevibacterium jeotgali]SMY11651.1 iron (metal) dependent repressor, DtxR family [Brevibacterium jeotgali]